MKVKSAIAFSILVIAAAMMPLSSQARSRATVKHQTIHAENPKIGEEWLVLPYAFSTDTLGTVFGVGGGAKGYYQEQLLVGGSVFGGPDEVSGVVLGAWNYQPPWTERFFLSASGTLGHYPEQRAYFRLAYPTDEPRRGSNESDKNDYVVTPGDNNWFDFKLEYVLPIGSARQKAMMTYNLKGGMLQGDGTGGDTWNPFKGGITTLMVRQYNKTEVSPF